MNTFNRLLAVPKNLKLAYKGLKQLAQQEKKLNEILLRLDTYNKQQQLLLWSILKGSQSLEETKKQFFLDLPKTSTAMAMYQDLTLWLLLKVTKICDDNSLNYWLDFGSLLGTMRHHGFIPWDDDIDLGMMRSEVKKLKQLCINDEDITMRDMYVVDAFNVLYVVRIMYKKYKCPCFVDIFIYDYCDKTDREAWNFHKCLRKELVKTTKIYSSNKAGIFISEITDPHIKDVIQGKFSEATDKLKNHIGLSSEVNRGIIWGIDNCTMTKTKQLFPKEMIFPLKTATFEGHRFYIPNNSEKLLRNYYGDIYEMPRDMLSHAHIRLTEEQTENLTNIYQKVILNPTETTAE